MDNTPNYSDLSYEQRMALTYDERQALYDKSRRISIKKKVKKNDFNGGLMQLMIGQIGITPTKHKSLIDDFKTQHAITPSVSKKIINELITDGLIETKPILGKAAYQFQFKLMLTEMGQELLKELKNG
jgi:DNA-binding MarR family transcriptional regulator